MPDDVWPVSFHRPGPGSLSSFNGVGFDFKGLTRVDAEGRCFATRWFVILYMPIIPLGRYYVREAGSSFTSSGLHSETTNRYEIAGTARLRLSEVLRTYLFCWLTPVAIVWPLIELLTRADDFSIWISLAAVAFWPMTGIALAVIALSAYRKRWAPLREVRWREDSEYELF